MDWKNLLPICKRCNGLKRDHDTKLVPIINPKLIDPREHLTIKKFRFFSKDFQNYVSLMPNTEYSTICSYALFEDDNYYDGIYAEN